MKTYYNKTLGMKVVASSKEEAIKVMSGTVNAKITIDTGIKKPLDVKAVQILKEVLRDMPSSKTNGTEIKSVRGKVILEIDPKKNDYFASDLDKCLFHLAKNLKRIVKKSCAWVRKGKEVVKELSTKGKANLVSDCYQLYDILMDRNTGKFTYASAMCLGNENLNLEDFINKLKQIAKEHNANFEMKERLIENSSKYIFTFFINYDFKIANETKGNIIIRVDQRTDIYEVSAVSYQKNIGEIKVKNNVACLRYVEAFCNKIDKNISEKSKG